MNGETVLTSVGIDIGTTTTQVVLSKLTLVNVMPGSQVPRVEITRKSIVYMGDVHFTPFVNRQRVDGTGIRKIVEQEYAAAGICAADIDTGAVIITGEAAKKENASEIIHALAEVAGDFVVATAGPDLESIIAGKGSGAEALSKKLHARIANVDIGGGTSNIAVFERGVCLGSACVNVGGRLFEVDPLTHRLSYITEPAGIIVRELEQETGRALFPAASAEMEVAAMRQCLTRMVQCVDRVLFGEPVPVAEESLVMSRELPAGKLDGIVFSGGVARYIYQSGWQDWWVHGDVGPLLAEAFRQGRAFRELTVHEGSETIHATVLGAGAHTVNISGSTITVSPHVLPLRNVPAVYPELQADGQWTWLPGARNFPQPLYRTVALIVPVLPDTDFTTITRVADKLAEELQAIGGRPGVVVAQQDIAKVLGQSLLRLLPAQDLVCIDGIDLKMGDFLDFARPLAHEEAVPVIVKTLVFAH
ncbi:MAG TPA: ethanolamine ammonia-lyase reactivating factor EutA [Negativicutes bacterium]|nr:ethanolamine ammonia-lyase reactivating factor EutA [Negativicutes bacterium]